MKKRSEEAREGGDEDAGETAGEGGGCSSPPFPVFRPRSQRGGA
jgi:hypothetical protein